MDKVEDRARELLRQSHERLQEIVEQAKAEVCRIQTLDEVLGEETLRGAFQDPFRGSLEVGRGSTPALPRRSVSPPTKPQKRKPTKPQKRKPTKPRKKKKQTRKKKPHTRIVPTIVEMVEKVLRLYPGQWFDIDGLGQCIKETGDDKVNRSSLQSALITLCNDGTPWLGRKKEGRKALYSLVQSQTGTQSGESAKG